MVNTDILTTVLSLVVAIFVFAVLLGMALGQPTLIAYVDSGSMEPTIDEGEGFIAIPDFLVSEYGEGDVVVFESADADDDSLSTHRIVEETDEGYITKGDANPFTDQDDGSPPVTDDRIVAKTLQIDGWVPTVPYVETVVTTITGSATFVMGAIFGIIGIGTLPTLPAVGVFIFAVGLLLFLLSVHFGSRGMPSRSYKRSMGPPNSINSKKAVVIVLIIILVPANAVMLLPSGGSTVSVDGQSIANEPGIEPGDDVTSTISARNDGFIAQFIIIESDREDVELSNDELQMSAGDAGEITATAPAPQPDEVTSAQITQYRYLYILPGSVIRALHGIHPLVAWAGINLVIVLAVASVAFGFLGFGRVRFRTRSRTTKKPK